MSYPPNVYPYTDINTIVNDLGLIQDPNNPQNYFLWQISTPSDLINQQVALANQYTTTLFGDLSVNPSALFLGQAYAMYWAELRIVQKSSINWQISGMPIQLGNVAINRLPGMQAAIMELKERLQKDIDKYYILLCDMSNIQQTAYRSPSPYVDLGGSVGWW